MLFLLLHNPLRIMILSNPYKKIPYITIILHFRYKIKVLCELNLFTLISLVITKIASLICILGVFLSYDFNGDINYETYV